jgi:hypothetical protein
MTTKMALAEMTSAEMTSTEMSATTAVKASSSSEAMG